MGTIKLGLEIAAVGVAAILVCFALYWKMGEVTLKRAREKQAQK
ncbi:MAG TPA: hypothetical protein VIU40_05410 [Geobacteraceae bacterium]